jgi:hypothetical protein
MEHLSDGTERVTVLVHGTWAKHAKWMTTGRLAEMLRQESVAVGYCWSGRNRHRDRLEAGVGLRQLLLEIRERCPDAAIGVVGHSHGGTVAAHALLGGGAVNDELFDVKLVTLATPFIEASPREPPNWVGILAPVLITMMVPAVVMFTFFLAVLLMAQLTGTPLDGTDFASVTVFETILWFVPFVLITLLLANFLWAAWYWGRRADAPPLWSLVLLKDDAVRKECDSVSSPAMVGNRFLVLRARGDEATGILGASSVLSWIATVAIRRLPWGITLAGLASLMILTLVSQQLDVLAVSNTLSWGTFLLRGCPRSC